MYNEQHVAHYSNASRQNRKTGIVREKIHVISGSRGTAGLKLMRKLTQQQSNQSKKAKIVRYYYQWQILKFSGKRKAKHQKGQGRKLL
jgi:hypothetical protein